MLFRVSAELQYRKNPWGLVKNFIEKNAYKGIEENFERLGKNLIVQWIISQKKI